MSNNLSTQSDAIGALPSLNGAGNAEVLGVPESKLKAKTNVGKTFYLIAFLGGALFIVFGVLFFMKSRSERMAEEQKQQPVKPAAVAKIDQTKMRNAALENQSLERVKAEIKKRQEAEAEIQAANVAKAQAAAAAAASEGPPAPEGSTGASDGFNAPPGARGGAKTGYQGSSEEGQPGQVRRLTLQEQRMAGSVFPLGASESVSSSAAAQVAADERPALRPTPSRFASDDMDEEEAPARASQAQGRNGLGDSLSPSVLEPRRAGRLSNLDFLLKKGMTIPCALRTGIDTTLPGFLTCVAISDVYSANGVTKLVERGATFFGEQKSAVAQGQARVFVVWNRVDNPSGVFAELDSPATDEMGYSGIGGHVDDRFWKRFGGAIMLSLIQDTLAAAVADREASGAVSVTNTSGASSQMATEALKGTINIPPTITVLPGKIINVMVARDVSFESVYGLVK